jgi:hypothetical protein
LPFFSASIWSASWSTLADSPETARITCSIRGSACVSGSKTPSSSSFSAFSSLISRFSLPSLNSLS